MIKPHTQTWIYLKDRAEEKDKIYWYPRRSKYPHIASYTHALSDIERYFNQVKVGTLSPNSKSISYFCKIWGWDWRKTLRWVSSTMLELAKNSDAMAHFKKLSEIARTQSQKVSKSVKKFREKQKHQELMKITDLELEFAEAMAEAFGKNKEVYKNTIIKNLLSNHDLTVKNFTVWKEKRAKEREERELEFKAKDFDYVKALSKVRIDGKNIAKAVDKGDYFQVWPQGQEHWLNHTHIVSKMDLLKSNG